MHKEAPINQKRHIFLIIVLFVLIFIVLSIFLRNKIPDAAQIISKVEEIYGAYGYYLIFSGALLEGTFVVGFYIPGSFIVFLGVSLARTGTTSFPLVILLGTLGLCVGYSINYCLGRFGWFRILKGFGLEKHITEAKSNLHKHYNKALFFGYIMPSTGSILSTASGVLKVPFRDFLLKSIVIQAFWSVLLGGLAYIFGMTFVEVFLVYFGTIGLLSLVLYFSKKLYSRKKKGLSTKV